MECQLIFNRMYTIKKQAGRPEPASWHKRPLSSLSFCVLAKNKTGICFHFWNWWERNQEIANDIFSATKLVVKFHNDNFHYGREKFAAAFHKSGMPQQWGSYLQYIYCYCMNGAPMCVSHSPFIGFDLFDLHCFVSTNAPFKQLQRVCSQRWVSSQLGGENFK